MARKIEGFEFSKKRGTGSKRPWDEWLNGEVWGLVAGLDYTCKVGGIKLAAKKAAKDRGKKLLWQIGKDEETGAEMLVIQAVTAPAVTAPVSEQPTPTTVQPKKKVR